MPAGTPGDQGRGRRQQLEKASDSDSRTGMAGYPKWAPVGARRAVEAEPAEPPCREHDLPNGNAGRTLAARWRCREGATLPASEAARAEWRALGPTTTRDRPDCMEGRQPLLYARLCAADGLSSRAITSAISSAPRVRRGIRRY